MRVFTAAMSISLGTAIAVQAQTPAKVTRILDHRGCSGCHAPVERVVGPSFAEIRTRYAGKAGVAMLLSGSIRKGSHGRWGEIDMPPNLSITDAELKLVLNAILKRN